MTETSKKGTQQHRGDKGASSSSTFHYVAVVPPTAAMEVTKNALESVAPPKDISANTFSFTTVRFSD